MLSMGLSSETSIFIFLMSFVLRFEEGIAWICCGFCCWLVSILWPKTISFASRFLFSRLAYSELRPPFLLKAWSYFPWDSTLLLVLRAAWVSPPRAHSYPVGVFTRSRALVGQVHFLSPSLQGTGLGKRTTDCEWFEPGKATVQGSCQQEESNVIENDETDIQRRDKTFHWWWPITTEHPWLSPTVF